MSQRSHNLAFQESKSSATVGRLSAQGTIGNLSAVQSSARLGQIFAHAQKTFVKVGLPAKNWQPGLEQRGFYFGTRHIQKLMNGERQINERDLAEAIIATGADLLMVIKADADKHLHETLLLTFGPNARFADGD